jgi:hypothetical protein
MNEQELIAAATQHLSESNPRTGESRVERLLTLWAEDLDDCGKLLYEWTKTGVLSRAEVQQFLNTIYRP